MHMTCHAVTIVVVHELGLSYMEIARTGTFGIPLTMQHNDQSAMRQVMGWVREVRSARSGGERVCLTAGDCSVRHARLFSQSIQVAVAHPF